MRLVLSLKNFSFTPKELDNDFLILCCVVIFQYAVLISAHKIRILVKLCEKSIILMCSIYRRFFGFGVFNRRVGIVG